MSELDVKFDEKEITKNGLYRIGVGAIIEKDGLIFCAKRLDGKGTLSENTIQMPQGGVDEGESFSVAIFREIFEETGIKKEKLQFLQRTQNFIHYDVPTEYRPKLYGKIGQTQIWYYFKFLGNESDINLTATEHAEFSEFFFKKPDEIIENGIDFKRNVYIKVFSEFGLIDKK